MKKTVLVAINSQYVHINLAVRYLKKYVEKNSSQKLEIYETNINNQLINIIKDIYELQPEFLIFSTYIWNKEYMYDIVREIKKILPNVKIALGGPEVSFEWEKIMEEVPSIDYILVGEGENVLLNLFIKEISEVKGVVYRKDDKVLYNGNEELIKNLDIIPFPYDDEELQDKNKIFYYESSRGCPFRCSYCMSSIDKSVRYYSIERTKEDLLKFINSPIKLLKFVDRTFNLSKEKYMAIWRFLLENYRENLTFHFEINANIFDEETLDFLETVPNGYFQFEIGVQTILPEAMKSIHRVNHLEKLSYNVGRIKRNIHLHLDLIAGLPYENYEKFRHSFDYVHNLYPEMIQLGFLKLLKGTQLYNEREKYGYQFFSKPPYEVFSNEFITFGEILKIKKIEKVLDYYYNSEKFGYSIKWVIDNHYESPFEFYEEISEYYDRLGYFKINHKEVVIFNFLVDFYLEKKFDNYDIFIEFLKLDYILLGKPGIYPEWLKSKKDGEVYDCLIKENNFKSVRDGHKNSELEHFSYNVLEGKKEDIHIFIDYRDKSIKIINDN